MDELRRIREIFGEFFAKILIYFERHEPPSGVSFGLTNILMFKSPVVYITLSREALYCAPHPEDLVKSGLRRQALQFADRIRDLPRSARHRSYWNGSQSVYQVRDRRGCSWGVRNQRLLASYLARAGPLDES